jgi:hypothetical protein
LRTEGDCEISLDFDCGAAPGTLLGELSVGEVGGRDNVGSVPVLAGRKAAVQWVAEAGSLPLRAAFRYSRNAEVRIRNVVIRRRQ